MYLSFSVSICLSLSLFLALTKFLGLFKGGQVEWPVSGPPVHSQRLGSGGVACTGPAVGISRTGPACPRNCRTSWWWGRHVPYRLSPPHAFLPQVSQIYTLPRLRMRQLPLPPLTFTPIFLHLRPAVSHRPRYGEGRTR